MVGVPVDLRFRSVRYPLLGFLGRISMPKIVSRALRYVPPAILTAIILPALVAPEGSRSKKGQMQEAKVEVSLQM